MTWVCSARSKGAMWLSVYDDEEKKRREQNEKREEKESRRLAVD